MSLRTAILALTAVLSLATAAVAWSVQLPVPWRVGLAAVAVVPLALLVPGLRKGRLQSYRLGAILSVFYVGFALTEVVAQPGLRWLPSLVLAAATGLIAGLILAIRQTTGRRLTSAHHE